MNHFHLASSTMLLAILLSFQSSYAQIPKLLIKFVEKQNKIQSGYVKVQFTYITDNDTFKAAKQESFFIYTPKDIKFISFHLSPIDSNFICKSSHTLLSHINRKKHGYVEFSYDNQIENTKKDINFPDFTYTTGSDFSLDKWKNCVFQRIPPKINKSNIRYKIFYPDEDVFTNISVEWEFEKKTFNWIQKEDFITYFKTDLSHGIIDILENKLYDYINPDILDTISFKYDELKKGYDQQCVVEQSKKDSILIEHLCDSIAQSVIKNGDKWIAYIPEDVKKDTLLYMPEWKFPLLTGDTLYSDSIHSRFLLMDMWYISCHPCRMAMRELATIDTLFDESLLKIVSLNVADKDTAKISAVVRNLNLTCDIACTFDNLQDHEISRRMGGCHGFPQIYLVDMKTKQVIWSSCGWYEGFTKDIEKIVKLEGSSELNK